MGHLRITTVIISFEYPFSEKEANKEAVKISRLIKLPVQYLTATHGLRAFPNGEIQKWVRIDVKGR